MLQNIADIIGKILLYLQIEIKLNSISLTRFKFQLLKFTGCLHIGFSKKDVDEIYDLIGTLQNLALTDQEYAVVSCFALMNPGNKWSFWLIWDTSQ